MFCWRASLDARINNKHSGVGIDELFFKLAKAICDKSDDVFCVLVACS